MRSLRTGFLRWTPTLSISRLTGRLARLPVPRPLRSTLWGLLARGLGIDLTEVAGRLDTFPSFGAFFARPLRPGCRPVDPDPDALVSPVDGRIVAAGPLEESPRLPIKGARFTPEELLADPATSKAFEGGNQITIYLSPADYHRIHAPFSATVEQWRYVPGRLLPVNGPTLEAVERLFPGNERVLSHWVERDRGRRLCMVLIGALNVGSIRVLWAPSLGDRPRRSHATAHQATDPRRFRVGEEVARFELGSTVVLLGGPGSWEPLELMPGSRVLQGRRLARWVDRP